MNSISAIVSLYFTGLRPTFQVLLDTKKRSTNEQIFHPLKHQILNVNLAAKRVTPYFLQPTF